MNLRSVDLNLLVALDALLSERHVTRAAERIGLSQPAMSNALSRLRHSFKDELLVRTASGMQPTPHALSLIVPLQQLLKQVERVLESDAGFEPARSTRTFTIRLSDVLGFILLPSLMNAVARQGANIGFDIVHLAPAVTVDALERDDIDVAVSMGLDHSNAIRSEILLRDRMVCVMRKSHPLARKALTLENFLAERHIKVSMSPTDLRFVDDVLRQRRLKRNFALNVPHWLLVPHVLQQTSLISVMPRRLATEIAGKKLVFRDLPFASAPFDWRLYWHRRHDGNPAIVWLRDQLRGVSKAFR